MGITDNPKNICIRHRKQSVRPYESKSGILWLNIMGVNLRKFFGGGGGRGLDTVSGQEVASRRSPLLAGPSQGSDSVAILRYLKFQMHLKSNLPIRYREEPAPFPDFSQLFVTGK